MTLTFGQMLRAKRIMDRNPHAEHRYIANKIGATPKAVKTSIAARKKPRRKRKPEIVPYEKGQYGRRFVGLAEAPRIQVPNDVWMEREARISAARTLTQATFGDPEPGRKWPDGRSAP
jgi:hypothetical protein